MQKLSRRQILKAISALPAVSPATSVLAQASNPQPQIPSLRNGRALPFAILATMYLPAEFSSKHKAITSSVSKTGKKIRVTGSALKA